MRTLYKYIFLAAILAMLFAPLSVAAQLEVTGGNTAPFTPLNLISNILLGEGIQVTNITYTGDPTSVGYFTGGVPSIGLERGIVMTSGIADVAVGVGGDFEGNTSSGGGVDPYLDAISLLPIFNVCAYEISFIPTADTLRFRYVFASEEYPEYACSSFNDVFGFFISGPGITGPYPNNSQNIALVPGTSTIVSIGTVNDNLTATGNGCDGNNSPEFYNSNNGSNVQPVYDGYLDVFTAQAVVIPCSTYTIRLTVADAGDSTFDTAVFLEAKSFGTGALQVEAATVSLDGTLTEGCSEGVLSFELPNEPETDYVVDYEIIGTATMGVDYATIQDTIIIPAGDTIVSFPLIAFEDGLAEGTESIGVSVKIDACTRDTFWIYIRDNTIQAPNLPDETTICISDSVLLDATLPVPLPDPPTFENLTDYGITLSNIPYFSPIDVFGVQPIELTAGVIQKVCVNMTHTWIDDIDLYLISPGGQFIQLATDVGKNSNNMSACFSPTYTTPTSTVNNNINALYPPVGNVPGTVTTTYFAGNFAAEGFWTDLYGGPTNGQWKLQVVDDQTGILGTLNDWKIVFNPLYQINYEWSEMNNPGLANDLSCIFCAATWSDTDIDRTYTVVATDSYGCEVYDTTTVSTVPALPAPEAVCGNVTFNSIEINWPAIPGVFSYQVSTNGTTWTPASGGFSNTLGGLGLNQSVTFYVQGIGFCESQIDTLTCVTLNCTGVDPTVGSTTPASCPGIPDGSVDIDATGVNPPFEYILGTQTNNTGIFTGLPPGSYTAIVVDALACGTSVAFEIGAPAPIIPDLQLANQPSCFGGNNGAAFVAVTGGVYPYSFAWSNLDADSTTTVSAASYDVTVTDAMGCQAIDTITVGQPAILNIPIVTADVSCNGFADGAIGVAVTGGTGLYSYEWSANAGGVTTSNAVGLSGGSYTVTVTDANGCTALSTGIVAENSAIILSTTSTNASCNGVFNGSATVNTSGGAGGYTILWGDPASQTSGTATGLTVGNYPVTVTDLDGCEATNSADVTSPNPISVTFTTDSTSCASSADGIVTLSVSGGTPFYSYEWSDGGAISSIRTDLASGLVSVTVSDVNNCFEVLSFDILAPAPLVITPSSTNLSCSGSDDGTASVVAVGGTPNYTYSWFPTNEATQNILNLGIGTYTISVTDANGCATFSTIGVIAENAIVLSLLATDVACFGEPTGSIASTVSGGTGTFSYLWSDAAAQTTGTATALVIGNYAVTVTDAAGCTASMMTAVSEPPLLTTSTTATMTSCFAGNNGTGTTVPIGGTQPYSYAWSFFAQNTPIASNLPAGEYYVTISDAQGCDIIDTTTVTSPTAVTGSLAGTSPSCNGFGNGTLAATASGGTGGYDYNWSTVGLPNAPNLSGIFMGTYSVTITDDNSCTASTFLQITEPEPLTFLSSVTDVACNGNNAGAIFMTVNGGTQPINYLWAGPSGFVSLDDDNEFLYAGNYQLTVTDANLCVNNTALTVTEPLPITAAFNNVNVSCYTGSNANINITTAGGTGNFTYVWNASTGNNYFTEDLTNITAATYTVTVTDANTCTNTFTTSISQPTSAITALITPTDTICNGGNNGNAFIAPSGGVGNYTYLWNTGQTNAAIGLLVAGSYAVTVTDGNGCTTTGVTQVFQKPQINVVISQEPALCNSSLTGSASVVSVSYGATNTPLNTFNYEWSNANLDNAITIYNLQGGVTYYLLASDADGCFGEASIEIGNPSQLNSLVDSTKNATCYGLSDGLAGVNGIGGTAPYNFLWGPNAASQTTQVATALGAGNYEVTVTDANGCIVIQDLFIVQPTRLLSTVTPTPNVCFGAAEGSAITVADGGTPPYFYAWSSLDSTARAEALLQGEYTVTVTDDKGCTTTATTTIAQPATAVDGTVDTRDISCANGYDGSITINPIGGTPPYLYSTDSITFDGALDRVGLESGEYTVYVRDFNGCVTAIDSIIINEPEPMTLSLGPDQTINYGESIQLLPQVGNGQGDLFYNWTTRIDSFLLCNPPLCDAPTVTPLSQEVFTLTVEDANGCSSTDDITIFIRKTVFVNVPTGFNPNGDPANSLLHVHGHSGLIVKSFRVYDRWGELLYEALDFPINDMTTGWNGTFRSKDMDAGIFTWTAEVMLPDGSTEKYHGETTLLR